jgi:hypothetical protein
MNGDHPTLEQQIEAVEWAEVHCSVIAKTAKRKGYRGAYGPEIPREFRRRLEAAAETLRTLEFGREMGL